MQKKQVPFSAAARQFLQGSRHRFLVLAAFLVLFTIASTHLLLRLQGMVSSRQTPDIAAEISDLHTLVSGSLVLSGLHPKEILQEAVVERAHRSVRWKEHRAEILVGSSFPLNGWLQGLDASLDRAGARLDITEEAGDLHLQILYLPEGWDNEIIAESLIVTVLPSPGSVALATGGGPRASIVIDDLGQNPEHLQRLLAIGIPLTISILPELPYSRKIAVEAAENDMEILLHLPMEPLDFPEKHPGPGALLLDMTEEQLRKQLTDNLSSIPGASGVNNHMGSRLTSDPRAMVILMEELRSRTLFFLDSKTSPHSLAFDIAYRYNLPTAQRDIFLDAHDDKDFVRSQVNRLLQLARSEGAAIALGHPYPSTLAVLEEMRNEILASGIEWVPVSELLVQSPEPAPKKISSLGSPSPVD